MSEGCIRIVAVETASVICCGPRTDFSEYVPYSFCGVEEAPQEEVRQVWFVVQYSQKIISSSLKRGNQWVLYTGWRSFTVQECLFTIVSVGGGNKCRISLISCVDVTCHSLQAVMGPCRLFS